MNEAAFSLFAVASSDLAIPDLKQRWRVKMAWSWISLVAVLVACAVTQLLGPGFSNRRGSYSPILSGAPLKWVGLAVLALFAICIFATHRYHRMDR